MSKFYAIEMADTMSCAASRWARRNPASSQAPVFVIGAGRVLSRPPVGSGISKIKACLSVRAYQESQPAASTSSRSNSQPQALTGSAPRQGKFEQGHPAPGPGPTPSAGTPAYPWLQQWYPVAVAGDLAPDRPHAVTLFGRQLALWRDGSSTWRAFRDSCPHRLAPLSEGRVDAATGQLVCSYHGWAFSGSGACAYVPQAMDEKSQVAACSSRRSCATAYPTMQAAGLVWVWPDAGPGAAVAAAARPPPVHPDLLQGGVDADTNTNTAVAGSPAGMPTPAGTPSQHDPPAFVNIGGGWLVREVPYDFTNMIENILDPGHAMFAHHGFLGRREDAVPFAVEIQGDLSLQGGFSASVGSSNRRMPVVERSLHFQPPCFVWQKIAPAGGGALYTCGYAVPARPGHCLLVTTSYAASQGGALQRLLVRLLPRWALHLYTQEVLDGDLALLHLQERNLEQAGMDWRRAYYMPTPSDGGVVAFRRWLDDLAGGPAQLPWPQGGTLPPAEQSKEQLLNRLHQHTERCAACSAMLRRLRAARSAGVAIAGAAAAAALWMPGWDGPATAAVAVGGVGMASLAAWMEPLFVFKDYVHAEH